MRDKIAIVTGGSGGLGQGFVHTFLDDGASVVVADLDKSGLEEFAASLDEYGDRVAPFLTDVSSSDDVKALVEFTIGRYGRVDAIVNNAGWGGARAAAHEVSDDAWRRTIDVNLTSVMLTARHAVPHMIEQGSGAIVNIASIQVEDPAPSLFAYCCAKGGVVAATRQMAVEYGPHGIRVNCISLSANLHHRNQHVWPDARRAVYLPHFPLRRFGAPSDVANAASYFISDEASFVTGQELKVDGGYSVQGPAVPGAWTAEYRDLTKAAPFSTES